MPALSAAQLAIWATSRDFLFCAQDEEILLARPESWALLIETLDDARALKSKQKTLLAALFVIVFDHLRTPGNDPELVRPVIEALRARQQMITDLGTRHMSGSIARRVSAVIASADLR